MTPKVSVVIPVYNIEQHLRQCLDSVLGQSLSDIEIICVDDGSTDHSAEILREYAARDHRMKVLFQSNAGPGPARNFGLSQATGEYLIFLDSDDWFEADFLARMVEKATQGKADVTICRSVSFDTHTGNDLPSDWMLDVENIPGGVFSPTEISGNLFQFTHGWPWDKLYRRKFVLKYGFQFPALRNSQDLVFVYPSLLHAERIAVVERVLIHHRFNRNTSVSNTRAQYISAPYEAVQMLKTHMEEHGLWELYQDSFLNWVAGFLFWHVSSIGKSNARKMCVACLRTEWLKDLGIWKHPISYYRGKKLQIKLLLVRYAPYWVFALAISMYQTAKRITTARSLTKTV